MPQKRAAYAAEQDRPDVKAARRAWFEAQPDLDPDRLVFLDETAATTTMARRYGRSRRGKRCRLPVPLGHRRTTTVTAALRTTGLLATSMFEGATNGERFRYDPAPGAPGDTVILDNLSTRSSVRDGGGGGVRLLFLPPYALTRASAKRARRRSHHSRPAQSHPARLRPLEVPIHGGEDWRRKA